MKVHFIWQELQRHGRHLQGHYRLIALFLVIATVILGATITTVNVHAASAVSCQKTYSVVRGDTLSKIAYVHKTTVQKVVTLNKIANPNLIYVGQKLCLAGSQGGTVVHPSPTPHGTISQTIYQIFGQYGGQAVTIATCESGLNPSAYNGVLGAAGLFQIIPGTWRSTSQAGQSPYNATANIKAAHEIFARDGYSWREWQCRS